jgi:hypothetical protein
MAEISTPTLVVFSVASLPAGQCANPYSHGNAGAAGGGFVVFRGPKLGTEGI